MLGDHPYIFRHVLEMEKMQSREKVRSFENICRQCWNSDPAQRPDMRTLLKELQDCADGLQCPTSIPMSAQGTLATSGNEMMGEPSQPGPNNAPGIQTATSTATSTVTATYLQSVQKLDTEAIEDSGVDVLRLRDASSVASEHAWPTFSYKLGTNVKRSPIFL